MNKIGVYSGTFDPVHKGHIGLALEAIKAANLDVVYFLPEPLPRRKTGVTHLAHRLAMLKLATQPYPKLKVLELPDNKFDIAKTLPRINQKFPGGEIYCICGVDVVEHMPTWPLLESFLNQVSLIVGTGVANEKPGELIDKLPINPKTLLIVKSPFPDISSHKIRNSLTSNKKAAGLQQTVAKYAKANWLYAVPSAVSNSST